MSINAKGTLFMITETQSVVYKCTIVSCYINDIINVIYIQKLIAYIVNIDIKYTINMLMTKFTARKIC